MLKIKYIKQAINKELDIRGQCKWLSDGPDNCQCPKCQIDRMDDEKIEKVAHELSLKFENAEK